MSTDPLPTARLVPQDRADRMALLRGQASNGARKAGRVAVTATKTLSILAICGIGLAALGAGLGTRSRSRVSDDLDRRLENIRRIQVRLPKLDSLDIQRLRFEVERSELQPYRRLQLRDQPQLTSEDRHARSRRPTSSR